MWRSCADRAGCNSIGDAEIDILLLKVPEHRVHSILVVVRYNLEFVEEMCNLVVMVEAEHSHRRKIPAFLAQVDSLLVLAHSVRIPDHVLLLVTSLYHLCHLLGEEFSLGVRLVLEQLEQQDCMP